MSSDVLQAIRGMEATLRGGRLGCLVFDRDCRYVLWNVSMERLTGLRETEVLGQNAFELFPFLREIGQDAYFERALEGVTSESFDRPFSILATDRRGFYNATYSPIFGATGAEVVGGIGLIEDITAQKENASRLQETERRFQSMADSSPVLLWMAGTDALCTFFNQTWLDFTGRTLAQEWGVGWAEGVHPEDFARCMDTYIQAFNGRRAFEMEYRLRRADGEYRWILDRGAPRVGPDGAFAGYIGSCVDITEIKRLEAEFRQSVRARDEFISVASHELKTPLTSLQLQIESLSRAIAKDPAAPVGSARLSQGIDAMVRQTYRLAGLVEQLLDVSRLSAGRLQLEYEPVELVGLVQEIVERLQPPAGEAGSVITVHPAEAVEGRWDRFRLEQAVGNLVSNAIKYGRGGAIDVHVEAAADLARIRVVDRGIGIPAEAIPRIFDRFERATSVTHFGGFGLGLWIAREIVTAHGGHITVESQLGAGSTFTVQLPRAPVAAAVAGRVNADARLATGS